MSDIRWPKPLRPGSRIAITAPSSGIEGPGQAARLDLVLQHLQSQGFSTVEGRCLRQNHRHVSASALDRAIEFNEFLKRQDVDAIFPPWGGELATELLDLLDFDELRATEPKWFLGYSDLSTLSLPLTLCAGWATAHGPNLMDLCPAQNDPLTKEALRLLTSEPGVSVRQLSSLKYQTEGVTFSKDHRAPFQLEHPTRWWRLDGSDAPIEFEGPLIGGCLDTIAWLAGTRYGDIPGFVDGYRQGGAKHGPIVYLENVEMSPPALVRCLLSLKRQSWFKGLSGLLLGRSAAPEPQSPTSLRHNEALHAALGDLDIPVLVDVDIGHRPPQFTLINGAVARVRFADAGGWVEQLRA